MLGENSTRQWRWYLDVERGSVFLPEAVLELLGLQLRQLLANVAVVPVLSRLLFGCLFR